jgi:hypothetical protein
LQTVLAVPNRSTVQPTPRDDQRRIRFHDVTEREIVRKEGRGAELPVVLVDRARRQELRTNGRMRATLV